jgi:hypothetical protein
VDVNDDKIAPIVVGVLAGMAARLGRMIQEDGWPSCRSMLGFVMQLGVIMLVAAVAVDVMGVTSPIRAALVASVLTMASNETLAMLRAKAASIVEKV